MQGRKIKVYPRGDVFWYHKARSIFFFPDILHDFILNNGEIFVEADVERRIINKCWWHWKWEN